MRSSIVLAAVGAFAPGAGAQDRCERGYARETGSMVRSLAATCGAELAHAYAKRDARAKAKTKTK
jgi:hypothetical protein